MGYEKKRMKIKLLDGRPHEMPNQPKQVYLVKEVTYGSDNSVINREVKAVYSRPLDAERAAKEIEKKNKQDLNDFKTYWVVRGFVVSLPLDPDGSY